MDDVKRPKGFFNIGNSAPKGLFDLEQLKKDTIPDTGNAECDKCGLFRNVNTPQMKMSGAGKLNVLLLGEAPGDTEDKEGIQFVGTAGKILRADLASQGIDLDRDFWKINAVNCHPWEVNKSTGKKGNRTPTKKEIGYCRPKWKAAIQETNPKFIILTGTSAVEAFFGDRKNKVFTKDLTIGRWRRFCIPDPVTKAWVIPILHPSFVGRQPEFRQLFKDDIKWAASCLNKGYPVFDNELSKITISRNLDDILGYIKSLNEVKDFAYDFETNTLKPYVKMARLYTIGISADGKAGFSFPYDHPNIFSAEQRDRIKEAFSGVLSNPNVEKIVHNRIMEELWSREFFVQPKALTWDTMIAAHVIEERDNITSLKFQSFIHWGILDYDKEVDSYKRNVPDTLYNRLGQLPWGTVCGYNGMDAMLTRRLLDVQKAKLRAPGLKKANQLLQDGMVELVKMTHRGIPVNSEYYETMYSELENGTVEKNKYDGIKVLENKINNSPEAIMFRNSAGIPLDMDSATHLRKLFFTYMGLKPIGETAKKKEPSVDADTLERLDVPIARQIVAKRKLKKIQDYVGLMRRLAVNNLIHPNFNLHQAKTYRSSSSDPNFQNIPKRDKFANTVVRSGIIAPEGYQILAADYGAMEVRGFAWYSKDPVLSEELNNHLDPHGYWADFLGLSEENPKNGRFDAKNGFVFPLIYGSFYKNILKDLRFRGYKKVTEDRVLAASEKFWEKYHYGKEWQEKLIADYFQNGYVETFLGFRRRGVLTKNQIVNYPIQATCFHMLVWSFIRLAEIREEDTWQSKQIAQIHDENFFLCKAEEFYELGKTIEHVMVKELMEAFPWIQVAPIAEFKASKIGGSWAEMFNFTKERKEIRNGKEAKVPVNDWESVKGRTWEGQPGDLIVEEEGDIIRLDGPRIRTKVQDIINGGK